MPGHQKGVIQPTLWEYAPGKLKMLMRSKNIGYIVQSVSADGGYHWTPGKIIKQLPIPDKGIDAVRMRDGTIALVYNHEIMGRLNIAFSKDNGESWSEPFIIENTPGKQFIYPSIIQTGDGKLHITYTWNRERIKHIIIDPHSVKMF